MQLAHPSYGHRLLGRGLQRHGAQAIRRVGRRLAAATYHGAHVRRRESVSCSPPRAATAPASTGPSSRSRRRWRPTARRSTSASRSCTTSTSSRRCEDRGAIFVEENDEVPEGATVVFSAHGVAPVVHEEAAAPAAQDDRRDLPAGDQGAPRGAPVRGRRLRHPADRPRGSRGGRRHDGRGARAHPPRRRPRRRRQRRRSATRRRSPGSRRPRCRSTRRSRRCAGCARGSPR